MREIKMHVKVVAHSYRNKKGQFGRPTHRWRYNRSNTLQFIPKTIPMG